MSDITFAEIMKFYPEHNRSVYEDLKRDCQRGRLIPFVGAGLSGFCGYESWKNVLKRLAAFVFDEDKRSQIEEMIGTGELLQAAQEIHDNYPRMLRELQKAVDYAKIRDCDARKLYASAAYALPYLFPDSPVMTTNFDRVLEEVYDRRRAKFERTVTPYEPDVLTQVRQENPHCLFKLHGDIGPEIRDAEKLVFTQTQYDRAYAADGPLMRELPRWFENKRLLFLGCSLARDKTMEVLQAVTRENSELDHYAILSCKPGEIGQRTAELGELGISAIYYPSGQHDAVRVILERLLEETDHGAYEELSRSMSKLTPEPGPERRFMYDSGYIKFTGREEELAQLRGFCQSDGLISWWAVTGPGGMGKSRLVHEFAKSQEEAGWKVCWLKHNEYQALSQWTPPADPCIVVADDVQAHLQAIGDWIASVSARRRSEKLRLLLLERDGEGLNSAKWAELLQAEFPYDDTIPSSCYRSDFLQLEPLSEEELKTIMADFAEASGKPLADGGHADRLLKTLQKIDGELQRPIYALAIADAWCSGQDPARWDKKQVLDTLVNREMRFYFDRLRNITQKKVTHEMRSEFENLLARSCLMNFLPLDEIPDEAYPKLRRRADELDMDLPELLRQIGIVQERKIRIVEIAEDGAEKQTESIETVILDCPDLVKEYLVLRQAFDRGKQDLLLPDKWDNDPRQLLFLRQVLRDYPEKLEEKDQFWNEFFAGNPETGFRAWIYSDLLFGVTVQLPKMEKRAVERLEKLHEQFQDNEKIAIEYAKSLVNLTIEQTLDDCAQSVDKLKLLHDQFQTSKEIVVEYAQGLVNLTVKQTLKGCVQSIQKLELLYMPDQHSVEIASLYAKGLANLIAEQTVDDCVQSMDKLEVLYKQFSSSKEVMAEYARGFINLTAKQTLKDCMQSVQKLKLLYDQFETEEELAVQYSGCLVNLSFKQTTEADVRETLKQSQKLFMQYPENAEIQLAYAQTRFNLTLHQAPDALRQTVAELREYLLAHPDANKKFQTALDEYLSEHPEHEERYKPLRV